MMPPDKLDADMAEYIDLLSQMGVPYQDRVQMTDRLCYMAGLPANHPSRCSSWLPTRWSWFRSSSPTCGMPATKQWLTSMPMWGWRIRYG